MKWVKKAIKSLRGIDTPIGGVSWEPKRIEDMEVDISFPTESGLQLELHDSGFKLSWCKSKRLPEKIEIQGWKKVIWEDSNGDEFYLRTYDGLTLIQCEC